MSVAPPFVTTREVYRTSRLLDFASERELTAQIGHPAYRWPDVTVKELLDNALDAAEEAGTPPIVSVRLEGRVLEVADEGPGIPEDVIGDIPDFSVRVSSREAYVAPSRGGQGNALMTIVAMPFALDGGYGLVEIQARGTLHRLRFAVDQIAGEPVVRHERLPSPCTGGTVVRVHWPEDEAELDPVALGDLLTGYALINPHLHLTADLGYGRKVEYRPNRPDWRRWRPSDPEPALWYGEQSLGRRIAAAIHHDRTWGGRVRTVRAFVATFQGLTATPRQKELLERLGLQRASLEGAFVRSDETLDTERIAGLLGAMRAYATPVRPRRLGELGKAHLASGTGDVVGYRRIEIDDPHAPILAEAALIFRKGAAGPAITVGINNSPALAGADAVPGLMRLLADALVERGDPVWFFLHLAGPGFRFADRGKSRLILPCAARERLETEIAAVLEPWHKYKKRKEREEKAELRLEETTKPEQPPTFIEAADRVIPEAYLKASDGGQLKVKPRQIGYAARDEIQELTGKPLSLKYFTQILIPDFISRHPEPTADWDIIWDARGSLIEPHTSRVVPLGTTEMEDYKAGWGSYFVGGENSAGWWKTVGPRDRYGAVLVIEKEGFRPLFEQVSLLERYDICLMPTKGVSTTEGRKFIDLCIEMNIPVFVLRDFDVAGFTIAGTLARDTRRYRWATAGAVDLGLRLEDVEAEGLQSERVFYETRDKKTEKKRILDPDSPRDRELILAKIGEQLRENGATEAEVEFLITRRVELNSFTSRHLVDWIERKLEAAGVRKVVPAVATLKDAAVGYAKHAAIAKIIAEHDVRLARQAEETVRDLDFEREVPRLLEADPGLSWDRAVQRLVNGGGAL